MKISLYCLMVCLSLLASHAFAFCGGSTCNGGGGFYRGDGYTSCCGDSYSSCGGNYDCDSCSNCYQYGYEYSGCYRGPGADCECADINCWRHSNDCMSQAECCEAFGNVGAR